MSYYYLLICAIANSYLSFVVIVYCHLLLFSVIYHLLVLIIYCYSLVFINIYCSIINYHYYLTTIFLVLQLVAIIIIQYNIPITTTMLTHLAGGTRSPRSTRGTFCRSTGSGVYWTKGWVATWTKFMQSSRKPETCETCFFFFTCDMTTKFDATQKQHWAGVGRMSALNLKQWKIRR